MTDPITTPAQMRKARIERLLSELEYEIVRGVMEREIEPDLHFSKIFPCPGRGDGLAALELHRQARSCAWWTEAMMPDPISTPAQMREAAARLIDGRCAEILRNQDGKIPEVDQNLRLMAAILPDLAAAIRALPVAEPAPVAVRVKPLVWEPFVWGGLTADTPWGKYIIQREDDDNFGLWIPGNDEEPNSLHLGVQSAQAAADADHAAHILAQIAKK